ncbi:hypothetical protein ACLOJK_001168 [Asimina triloba]
MNGLFSLDRMNGHEEEKPHCYFHPREIVVGICALCLRERLLNLASKQGQQLSPANDDEDTQLRSNRIQPPKRKPTPASFPKVFAFSYFLRGSASRHRRRRSSCSSEPDISTSHEDSFISIKFEEDGRTSWTHTTSSGISSEPFKLRLYDNMDDDHEEDKTPKGMVEFAKTHRKASGWRKRIGRLLHLMRLRRRTSLAGSEAKVEYSKHKNCFKAGRR